MYRGGVPPLGGYPPWGGLGPRGPPPRGSRSGDARLPLENRVNPPLGGVYHFGQSGFLPFLAKKPLWGGSKCPIALYRGPPKRGGPLIAGYGPLSPQRFKGYYKGSIGTNWGAVRP